MVTLGAVIDRPRMLRALTGLDVGEFKMLACELERVLSEKLEKATCDGRKRLRACGAGRPGVLNDARQKLFFILVYFTVYPIQELQGFLFGMSQGSACDWIHRLTPVLEQVLGRKMCLPKRACSKVEELFAKVPGLYTLMDCTERPVRRPGREPRQRAHYSGKRKRHTLKNLIISDKRRVLGLGETRPGTIHDIRLAEEVCFPEGTNLLVDSGFQGFEAPGVVVMHPIKKPRGAELDAAQKDFNRHLSSQRVRVEHAIGGIKRSHIIADIYRNIKPGFDDLSMMVASGLHNFRVKCRCA